MRSDEKGKVGERSRAAAMLPARLRSPEDFVHKEGMRAARAGSLARQSSFSP